jgi:hypothetical protein
MVIREIPWSSEKRGKSDTFFGVISLIRDIRVVTEIVWFIDKRGLEKLQYKTPKCVNCKSQTAKFVIGPLNRILMLNSFCVNCVLQPLPLHSPHYVNCVLQLLHFTE